MTEKILIDTGPSERGWHRLESILRCPFLYAFNHRLRSMGSDASPLIRGTLGHIGLAHYYARLGAQQHGLDPEAYYTPSEAIDLKVAKEGGQGWWAEHQTPMKMLVQAYATHFVGERMKVKAIEVPVEMQIGGHRITQRFDLVMQAPNRLVYVWDHKVVAKIDGKTSQRYDLSGQFLEMVYQGRNKYGDQFGGVRINLLQADGQKFVRISPNPAPYALAKFPETVAHAEKLIAEYAHLQPHEYPRVFSEMTCMTAYGPCAAHELCSWGPANAT